MEFRKILGNILFLNFGFFFCYFFGPYKNVYLKPGQCDTKEHHFPLKRDTIKIHDTIYIKKINASYYNPSVSQCDATPFHTADGTHLTKNTKNVVSLSRDLLKKFPFGSKIEVVHPKKLKGVYRVHDCMHKRFKNKIDFFTFGTINIRSVLIKYHTK